MVRIYGYPVSTWTRTVWMTCIEKGIDHEPADGELATARSALRIAPRDSFRRTCDDPTAL